MVTVPLSLVECYRDPYCTENVNDLSIVRYITLRKRSVRMWLKAVIPNECGILPIATLHRRIGRRISRQGCYPGLRRSDSVDVQESGLFAN